MTHSLFAANGRRLVGWVAIIGALLGWTTVGLYGAATGGDFSVVFKPEVFLTLPSQAHTYLHWAMVVDTLGFYLPFLIVGGYLWSLLRNEHGAIIDMATLCIVTYVAMGIAGASILFATVSPLAALHTAGDALNKAASEAAWLAVANAAQHGLWIMEGPVMGFWGLVIGKAMRASGMAYGRLLMVVGACYISAFFTGVLGLEEMEGIIQAVFFILLPLWALLTGIALSRQRDR
ncbi:hypothetical protein JFU37_29410 [Pseudomonas sp. TH41]|uniref:hypothetical protein n=1 Tax=Pseudomonas sp. TH41 TaxID=2796405 RepID=UPI001913E9FF|nr:hypothetical protein [Pseudomonas sp. TH41]MBK5356571.1 hypothetical protein [Pseudomonas sp. TH41]